LIEDIQRENLNALEVAQSYQRLLAELRLEAEETWRIELQKELNFNTI